MRCDPQTVPVRLFTCGGHLFLRKLSNARNSALRQNASRCNELDAIGACKPLFPHSLPGVPWPIHRAADRPAVAARHAQDASNGANARALDAIAVYRFPDLNGNILVSAQIANGRYARFEGLTRIF